MKNSVAFVLVILNLVASSSCWQYYLTLSETTLSLSEPDPVELHSDYTFGVCDKRYIVLYAHIFIDHLDILGKIIVRGWLDLRRVPNCIIMRSKSYAYDTLRNTAYEFQMCVPRITYCHTHNRYRYFYYEWYIPYDYLGGMNWDIYFYGPKLLKW